MATMIDSVTPAAIPKGTPVVAGYVDGPYGPGDPYHSGWNADAWTSFPGSQMVSITVHGSAGARVYDIETGDGTPAQGAAWAKSEIAAGRRPTLYFSTSLLGDIVGSLRAVGVAQSQVDFWGAQYPGGGAVVPAGYVAHQYLANQRGVQGSYIDYSVTNGVWPGNSPAPGPGPAPAPLPQLTFKPLTGRYGVLNKPVVAIVRRPQNDGYWEIAADGGTFNYGKAPFLGSLAQVKLVSPIIDAGCTPSGAGLTLVATDGGIFNLGDSQFYGSMGGKALVAPVVSIEVTASGNGYLLAAADGGIFAFGDGQFLGSPA